MDDLVTTGWLAEKLGSTDLLIVDTTYVLNAPDSPLRDPAAEFRAAHIPGAAFLDLTGLKANDPSAFISRAIAAGLTPDRPIILYDSSSLRSSARAWWLLRAFGVRNVAILDGGWAKWKHEGRSIETGDARAGAGRFRPRIDDQAWRTLAQMRANLDSGAEQVVDARPPARFSGAEDDPRPGVGTGHIPGSRNLPHSRLFAADGTWLRDDALRAAFTDAGVDLARPTIATCGSGITASVLAFGAHLLGADVPVYDGSWAEWGADPFTPKALGTI